MTLRLPVELADQLETVAAVEGQPVAEVVRAAIAAHIDGRRTDPEFRAALAAHLERARKLLG